MNLNDYFDPVSLEKPDFSLLNDEYSFSRSLYIHTPDHPIKRLESFDLALIGVCEDRNALIKGSSTTADRIRSRLYLLGYVNRKTRMIDLGNIKQSPGTEDAYYALRDVITELNNHGVVAIIMGGSQDMTVGMALFLEKWNARGNFTTLDSKLDFGHPSEEAISSHNYLDSLFSSPGFQKINHVNVGHQVYFTPLKLLDQFEKKGYESIRLGTARDSLSEIEPVLRDTHILSIDMSVVRQSDAPAASLPTPNGFFGHEFCQLTRYAGASSNMRAIAFFEINTNQDFNDHTTHLAAQAIWYFVEGFSLKVQENPQEKGSKKFIVKLSGMEENLIFYKSLATEKWWMELPVNHEDTGKGILLSCSYEDYKRACKDEIPDRWWKRFRKFD